MTLTTAPAALRREPSPSRDRRHARARCAALPEGCRLLLLLWRLRGLSQVRAAAALAVGEGQLRAACRRLGIHPWTRLRHMDHREMAARLWRAAAREGIARGDGQPRIAPAHSPELIAARPRSPLLSQEPAAPRPGPPSRLLAPPPLLSPPPAPCSPPPAPDQGWRIEPAESDAFVASVARLFAPPELPVADAPLS